MSTVRAWLLAALLVVAGCGKSGSGGASASGGSGAAPSENGNLYGTGDPDAVNAVYAELTQRWVQTPDGWVSEFPQHVYIATGQRADAASFYRQIKELKFDIQQNDLSDADKLNGYEYNGYVQFRGSPIRTYDDPNSMVSNQWTSWTQSDEGGAPSFKVYKQNGKWTCDGDCYLIEGTQPSQDTIAQLK